MRRANTETHAGQYMPAQTQEDGKNPYRWESVRLSGFQAINLIPRHFILRLMSALISAVIHFAADQC